MNNIAFRNNIILRNTVLNIVKYVLIMKVCLLRRVIFHLEDFIMINRHKNAIQYHTIEIKDIRCIHQGREKGDGSHFASLNVLIYNWNEFSLCTISHSSIFDVYYNDYMHTCTIYI